VTEAEVIQDTIVYVKVAAVKKLVVDN